MNNPYDDLNKVTHYFSEELQQIYNIDSPKNMLPAHNLHEITFGQYIKFISALKTNRIEMLDGVLTIITPALKLEAYKKIYKNKILELAQHFENLILDTDNDSQKRRYQAKYNTALRIIEGTATPEETISLRAEYDNFYSLLKLDVTFDDFVKEVVRLGNIANYASGKIEGLRRIAFKMIDDCKEWQHVEPTYANLRQSAEQELAKLKSI